jgi:hypothetical protein
MSKIIELEDNPVSLSGPTAPAPPPGPPGSQDGGPPPSDPSTSTQLLAENEGEEFGGDELRGAMSGSSGLV